MSTKEEKPIIAPKKKKHNKKPKVVSSKPVLAGGAGRTGPPVKKKKDKSKSPQVKQRPRMIKVDIAANAQNAISVACNFDNDAMTGMCLSLMSRVLALPWQASSLEGVGPVADPSYVADFYIFLQMYLISQMTAQTSPITKVSSWLHVIANLLSPHDQPFRNSLVKYSWDATNPPIVSSNMTQPVRVANVPYVFIMGYPDPNTPDSYDQLIQEFQPFQTPSTSNFQKICGLLVNQSRPDTALVDVGTVNVGKYDSSAYARSYTYLGIGDSVTGCVYGSCELECSYVRSWMAAQFCPFKDNDVRVSHSFRTKTGDSALLMNLPFIGSYTMNDYKNNGPVIYKFIDFEEIYTWVISWYKEAVKKYLNNQATASNQGQPVLPQFEFSSQTFRVVLRQALLQIFTDQTAVQFMAPRAQVGQNDNVFVPFMCNGGTYSATMFGQLKLPQLLVENLRMLKTYEIPTKTKTRVTFIPVLGRWVQDIWDADPSLDGVSYENESGNPSALFLIQSTAGEHQFDLIDGTDYAQNSSVVNFNSAFMQSALAQINFVFSLLVGSGGTLTTANGDGGPGLNLLAMTRYIKTYSSLQASESRNPFAILEEHRTRLLAKRASKQALKKDNSKKTIFDETPMKGQGGSVLPKTWINYLGEKTDQPPGGTAFDYTDCLSCQYPVSESDQMLLNRLILPTIRPIEETGNTQLVSEWQIANYEPYRFQVNISTLGSSSSASRTADLLSAATSVLISPVGGNNSDELSQLFERLAQQGKSVNWGALLQGAIQVGSTVVSALTS